MGIERDFLMRQLLMLFNVIHKILRLRKNGEDEKADNEIKYFYECLKLDKKVDELGSTISIGENEKFNITATITDKDGKKIQEFGD